VPVALTYSNPMTFRIVVFVIDAIYRIRIQELKRTKRGIEFMQKQVSQRVSVLSVCMAI
jgi:hypothetical protein